MSINEKLQQLTNICEINNISALENDLDSLMRLLNEEQYINIAVLGQFKAGKSSFINSILGQKILPTGIVPITNVVTIVEKGEKLQVFVYFLDETVKKIEVEQLSYWISEEENSKNQKNVQKVVIKYPLAFDANIRFVDTPGLNSVFEHNSEETLKWLPNIGISLILISATNPLSQNDLQLVKNAMEYSPEVFIVLSKVDLLSDEDVQKLIGFIKKQLKNEFERDFVIFPNSFVSRTYSDKILEYIQNNLDLGRGGMQKIIQHKFDRIKLRCTEFLEIKKQIIIKQTESKDELKNQIFDEKFNSALIKKELLLIKNDYSVKIRNEIEKFLFKNFKNQLIDDLKNEFDEYFKSRKGNLNKLTKEYENWIRLRLREKLKEISLKRIDYDSFLSDSKKHFEFYLNSFKQRLNDKIFDVLGIRLKNDNIEIKTEPVKYPNTHISWAFDTKIDLLWFLIPMFLFRKTFLSHFRKQIDYEVEKNLYRFTSEVTKSIVDEMNRMSDFVVEYIENEINTLENLLSDNSKELETINTELSEIKSL